MSIMSARKHIKVLVIRFSSIGDIVLTTPVLRCLKKIEGTDTEVHVVTKKAFAGVLAGNPNVDKLHLLNNSLWRLASHLRKENFDYIVDLHHNIRSAILKGRMLRPSGSFHKLNPEKWMLTALKINKLPEKHIVDRYFEAADALGVENDHQGLDFFPDEEIYGVPEVIPGDFQQYIAFAIGGKHATKRLPNEKIVAICKKLPLPVILLGDRNDEANGDAVVRGCKDQKVFNACGKLSLRESAYMVKNARAVISHDTGLMHIAAAYNKILVSVWGNTVPEFGMVPYMPRHPERSVIIEVKDLPCRPCTKLGYEKCPKKHFDCMMKINEDDIIAALDKMLEKTMV